MIVTDGKPTIAWAKRPRPNVPKRVSTDREKYKRELAERAKRLALDALE